MGFKRNHADVPDSSSFGQWADERLKSPWCEWGLLTAFIEQPRQMGLLQKLATDPAIIFPCCMTLQQEDYLPTQVFKLHLENRIYIFIKLLCAKCSSLKIETFIRTSTPRRKSITPKAAVNHTSHSFPLLGERRRDYYGRRKR